MKFIKSILSKFLDRSAKGNITLSPGGSVELIHEGVKLYIYSGPYLENSKPTDLALAYSSEIVKNQDSFRLFAADRLVGIYNKTWLNDEIGSVSKERFSELLFLEEVVLMDEIGFASVVFDSAGLFADHAIEVSLEHGIAVDASI